MKTFRHALASFGWLVPSAFGSRRIAGELWRLKIKSQ
jgi:hypothetical protein